MPTVLITGAARGIGRAATLRLARAGWNVYAGVRSELDGAALAEQAAGIRAIRLDITVADDIAALEEQLPASLDGVVNNAGISVGGPVEALPLDELRRQFEVNVFGQVAVTQAVLPRLRTSRGRIVFVSSLSGRVATPLTGAYNGSKFALEAITDALRIELRPWRIRVSLIEPAQTDTDMWRKADDAIDEAVSRLAPKHRALYAKHIAGLRKTIPLSQRMASDPDGVAAAIERALTARRPRARYVVGAGAKVQSVLSQLTPTPVRDAALAKLSGVPRTP